MNFNIRDPKHRMEVTFPGRPITRRVSPDDIERYLKAKGYESARSAERDWPRDIAYFRASQVWPGIPRDFNAKAQRAQRRKPEFLCIFAPLRLCAFALKSLFSRRDPCQNF
ncbi:uncharacterized protein SOCE26_048900 [Sorangium cellulosum]|uniref:Uncharacterized protein n=1 Tax=Sorangium cellulosum TaxID=56 RepID=A0A2L0EVZ2_SORCE|nr:hypothetical protein [Sorangium cellulosum]AUX43442.1 uncharacterized protein SOCE26_048900 [Sorangium cellulosum]